MADKSLLNYKPDESIGLVNAVDTGTATAMITDESLFLSYKLTNCWRYIALVLDGIS